MSQKNCDVVTVQLEIATGDDAFVGQPAVEIARILRDAATWIETGGYGPGTMEAKLLRDVNGNCVGHVKLSFSED